MIKFTLSCDKGHAFEGWFRSSSDYEAQEGRGLLECPVCASKTVGKALMAPAVRTPDGPPAAENVAAPLPAPVDGPPPGPMMMPDPRDPAMREMMKAFKQQVLANTEDVGDRFAEEARKIHYEEAEKRSIRGKATPEEAQALREEGVEFAPLPIIPDEMN